MDIQNLKNSSIVFVVEGFVKDHCREYCAELVYEPTRKINEGCGYALVQLDRFPVSWVVRLKRVWEDWGTLYAESTYTSVRRYIIKAVDPCHKCRHRLARLLHRCPAKYEPEANPDKQSQDV